MRHVPCPKSTARAGASVRPDGVSGRDRARRCPPDGQRMHAGWSLLAVPVEKRLGHALGELLARLDARDEVALAEEWLATEAAQEPGRGRLHLGPEVAVEGVVHEAEVVARADPGPGLRLRHEEPRARRCDRQRLARA